jgi:phosphonate degradation associated HDIG domain protein
MSDGNLVDDLLRLFETRGETAYHGERVSQTEHALQCAYLAEREGADGAAVVAALLHDIGHLLPGLAEDLAERGIDGRHECAGAAWLARLFGPEVTEPVRLHVPAKRYLCATEPAYLASLSPASLRSLELQGGPLDPAEVAAFERQPHWQSAVRLRRWDDAAKVPGLAVPGLAHYRARVEAHLSSSPRPRSGGEGRSTNRREAGG